MNLAHVPLSKACLFVIILYSANGLGTLEAVQTVLMMMVVYDVVELNEFET